MPKVNFNRGLILALDETDYRKAMNIVNTVGKYVDAIKLNWPIILANGPQIITEISNHFRVICDFKVSDVPHTNSMVTSAAVKLGASGIIVHGFTGIDAVEACINSAHGASVFLVVEMSNPGSADFGQRFADELAGMAVQLRVDGVVAPATRPERIKHFRSLLGKMPILAPGVGAQGGDAREAITNGADALIVGRSIYGSSEPLDVVNTYLSEIQSGREAIAKN
ncbi:MAG: orotidine-5'-phosphate decarboxylase [Candidatus Thermoplasmatota archaeon]|jgi:orotidine-5'-phosphate decarboxylase|nr:orotidine-5'-phosphate decarboxylase [Candidatus Sysuiplasma jiujiangense]MBX8638755.1 orotidine-5'-phosphate decarboxylase [Candidatus Sysuiplasma jiujiangense]MCL5252791.1 orotidine-5'-phosphate decarboxylase [Candidatus Thermoplasmatota archaeon]